MEAMGAEGEGRGRKGSRAGRGKEENERRGEVRGGEGRREEELEQTELKVSGLKEKKACCDNRCLKRRISYFSIAVIKTL